MATVHRLGFTRLSGEEGNDDQFSLNIVFVHGLRGHPRGTWEAAANASNGSSDAKEKLKDLRSLFKKRTAKSPLISTAQKSSHVYWPEEYLAPDVPQARVWTYGYDADVIGGLFQANNKNSISQHGRDLSVRLEREIENTKPIAFVVHSLGGIILKDAIRRSETIRNHTKLIIFLGTPHRGSAYAGWGQIASNLARLALQDSNKKIIKTLEVNNETLDNIHEEFKTIAFKGTMKIHSFQEARGISGMKGLDEKVVDDFSSKLDLPGALETVESITADHMEMARYGSRDNEGYRAISGILKAFVRRELEGQRIPAVHTAGESSSGALFIVPFPRDDWFVGRVDILAEISKYRAPAQTHTRLALVGIGGVGKSQIAIEYAHRVQEAEPRTRVVWIHASNPTRFKQGYTAIADKASLPGREDPKVNILQLVHDWLADKRNGRWLMILDNVDDDSVFFASEEDAIGPVQRVETVDYNRPLESFLPQTANGTVLVTSRNKTAATNLVGLHGSIIQVEPMEEEDALALLQTRVPFDESSKADAKALVHTLELIPLAITQAAAYIKMRAPLTSMASYLKLFYESRANQIQLLGKKEWKDLRRDHSIRHAVMATWQISFSQIQKMEQPAADLLALMSMFDKQGIPRWLLQGDASQLDFDDALAPLLSFSLVKMEIGEQVLAMHRLVQLSMRVWLEAKKELGKWTKESIRALSMAFPSGEYGTWEDCKTLLPHAREVIGHAIEDEEDMLNKAESGSKAGWYLFCRGEYRVAEAFLRISVENREKILGPEHPDTLISVSNLGLVLERQGKYEEAEAMHRRDLEWSEKVLGPEHPDTLASVSNLGSVLERQGKYEEAEVMHRRDLEGSEKVLGLEHPDTLTSVNNLGLVLGRQGKYEEAKAMHRRALETREEVLGPEHPDTLASVSNLGLVLERQGKYEEAKAMHRRALETREEVLGPEHPDTLTSVSSLGSVLWNQGHLAEAEELELRVLEASKRVLGEEHPNTLTMMANLAFTLQSQSRTQEALSLMETCSRAHEHVVGRDHPDTKFSLEMLDEWQTKAMEMRD